MYQLEVMTPTRQFVPIATGTPEELEPQIPKNCPGYRIVKADRPRRKDGELRRPHGLNGTRQYHFQDHKAQARLYAKWLSDNGRTEAYVFPIKRPDGTYSHLSVEVRDILKRAGFTLVEVDYE